MSFVEGSRIPDSLSGKEGKVAFTKAFPYSQVILSIVGFSISLRMFFPGLMSSDSVDQLSQAVRFSFQDWHPPVMAFVWALINDWVPGPFGMLALHSFLYWMALFLFSISVRPFSNLLSLMVVALGYTPVAIGSLGAIWKDVFFATLSLFSISLVFYGANNCSKGIRSLSTVAFCLLSLGALARVNSLAALPPLLWLILGRPSIRDWRVVGAVVFLVPVLIAVFGVILTYGVLRAERTGVHSSLLVFDLGGVSHYTRRNLLGDSISGEHEQIFLTSCYRPASWDGYAWGDCSFVARGLHESGDWGKLALVRKWKQAVLDFPGEYLEHRWAHWSFFLGSGGGLLQPGMDANPWGYEFHKSALYRSLERLTHILQDTWFYKPGFWLLAATCLWGIGLAAPRGTLRDFANGLNLSGVLYLFSYFFLGVASDFRYAYWSILATLVSVPLLCSSFLVSARRSAC